MSRGQESSGGHAPASAQRDSGAPESIGSYLARHRHLRGISLDELAQLTRIPIRSLERLEAGSYDGVTDGFVRGFVRTVAQSLGLEPDDTVARMLREPALEAELGSPPSRLLRRLLMFAGGIALLLLAFGLLRALMQGAEAPAPEPVEQVFRRDAVRLLADSERADRHRDAEPAEEQAPGDPFEQGAAPGDPFEQGAAPGDGLEEGAASAAGESTSDRDSAPERAAE